MPKQMRPVNVQSAPAVHLTDLAFRWQVRDPDALDIATLSIAVGERVFVSGPSGSGKSTLLNLLSGVIRPNRGTAWVLGEPLHAYPPARRDRFRARHVGYLFQLFNLVPYLSTLENVLLPCRFSRRRRQRALARSPTLAREGLRLLERLGLAQADVLRRPVTTLSVGQQQRVAAARALIGDPELLIADEPTSALDADLRADFARLLFDECRATGATLVVVSHDTALEPLFDRGIRLLDVNRVAHALVSGRR